MHVDALTIFDQLPFQGLGVGDINDPRGKGEEFCKLCRTVAPRSGYQFEAIRVEAHGDGLDQAVVPDALGTLLQLALLEGPVTLPQLSLLLLALGLAGFLGTSAGTTLAKGHLYLMLGLPPVLLAGATLWMLLTQHILWSVALAMFAWGAINSAVPVCWSTWLSQGVRDEPESGGGLLVGAIQLSIMLGGALGGYFLDRISISATSVRPSSPEPCSCFYSLVLLEAARGFVLSHNKLSSNVDDWTSGSRRPP